MLEPIWSGQKGVYIGSGLRGMESYSTHAPTVEGFTLNLFPPTTEAVEDCIRVYGPLTRAQVVERVGGGYVTVSATIDRLLRRGRIRVKPDAALVGTRGRSAQQFEVV